MHLSGNIFDYFIAYWSGVLVSFTPCVYPVIPLTAGFIAGANVEGTRWKGFVISLIYVFGIAITYCALGVVASLSGQVFGQFQNSSAVYAGVGVILVMFGLVMLDVVKIPMLGINVQPTMKPKNVWTILLFGITSGLVIGPCTAPILGTLLLYVASKQNIIHGVSLLFVFSYGVGTSLILVGTFSGLVSHLPKSGQWMKRMKQFCGIFLLVIAIYFFLKAGRIWL